MLVPQTLSSQHFVRDHHLSDFLGVRPGEPGRVFG